MGFIAEHEVRILNVDFDKMVQKIIELGGELVFSGFQQRHVFDVPSVEGEDRWLRLRSNGEKTTLTLKKINAGNTKEIEVEVNNYDAMLEILELLGIEPRAFHENYRSEYKLPNGIIVTLDRWPQIPLFMEIEGANMEIVLQAVALLGFTEADISPHNIVELYRSHGIENIQKADLKFNPEEHESINS